jgi:hypothetical protein
MRAPRGAAWLAVSLTVALAAGGCTKKPPPAPVPVQGRVEFAGRRPAARLVLTFHPRGEDNKGTPVVSAVVDEKGRFEGSCMPGRYKVTLAVVAVVEGNPAGSGGGAGHAPAAPKRPSAHSKYERPEQTPWEVTVPAGGEAGLVLRLP